MKCEGYGENKDMRVGLNGEWLCLDCFKKAMANVGKQIKSIKKAAEGIKG